METIQFYSLTSFEYSKVKRMHSSFRVFATFLLSFWGKIKNQFPYTSKTAHAPSLRPFSSLAAHHITKRFLFSQTYEILHRGDKFFESLPRREMFENLTNGPSEWVGGGNYVEVSVIFSTENVIY